MGLDWSGLYLHLGLLVFRVEHVCDIIFDVFNAELPGDIMILDCGESYKIHGDID